MPTTTATGRSRSPIKRFWQRRAGCHHERLRPRYEFGQHEHPARIELHPVKRRERLQRRSPRYVDRLEVAVTLKPGSALVDSGGGATLRLEGANIDITAVGEVRINGKMVRLNS